MLLLWFISCSGGDNDTVLGVTDPEHLQMETVDRILVTQDFADVEHASAINEHLLLISKPDGTYLLDERDQSEQLIGSFTSVSAVALDDTIFAALDGEVYTIEEDSLLPFFESLSVPIEQLKRTDNTLWLYGSGKLFRWQDNVLIELSIAEYDFIYDFAANNERIWVSTPWLMEIDLSAEEMTVITAYDHSVDSMTVDENGHLWFVSEQKLWVKPKESKPLQYELEQAVLQVLGPSVWIRSEGDAYHFKQGRFSQHSVADGLWSEVDSLGRLLHIEDGMLQRHSIGRPVALIGLSDPLLVQENIQILPSDPESITDIRLWLNQQELTVEAEPWVVTVDPEGLSAGEHSLRILCETSDASFIDEHTLVIGNLPEADWSDIEAISEQHCLSCHDGSTLTTLVTKEDWEYNIYAIIDQISRNVMPLGGPYLSDDQIAMIRGWKQGGFQ